MKMASGEEEGRRWEKRMGGVSPLRVVRVTRRAAQSQARRDQGPLGATQTRGRRRTHFVTNLLGVNLGGGGDGGFGHAGGGGF